MKTLILAFMLLATLQSNAQCWLNDAPRKSGAGPTITAALVIDKSMRFYEPTGFSGTGIHAGIWIDWLGFTLGGVESKVNRHTQATREMAFTMIGRYTAFDELIQINPFFSVGTHNFQDVGIRVGYRIGDGVYLGGVASRAMKYGINFSVSINHSK